SPVGQMVPQKVFNKGSCSSRKGLNGACSVHEYMGTFSGQSVRFKMTSVCGHVMSLDFIGKYNNWDKVDPAELFTKAPTEKKEANPKLNMVKFLQVEGKGCDYVVLWLDCDKEGENICFEVIPIQRYVLTTAGPSPLLVLPHPLHYWSYPTLSTTGLNPPSPLLVLPHPLRYWS
uniref:DNA topoisomerase n=1 Tax=Hucho hucho TaxID=62062 RepID=A0A4W5LSP5_9TELE